MSPPADAALISDRRALEAKTQALERFLMELGHDLKTPLASLKLSVDELVTPTSGEAGRAAMAELLYVEQLVENLRLEARLQQGGL
ncbi:MAG: histidine kinase dimerization/phospho-acceptor domain-containing protein, partial [Myxococcales bacterium]|nr:histidine kinase dimerization/phospho-acceptor domain-containing protein [Myxococcales bacterium]